MARIILFVNLYGFIKLFIFGAVNFSIASMGDDILVGRLSHSISIEKLS